MGADGQPTVQALINKNSPVPASASTTFYTNRPEQNRMIIEAVQKRTTDVGVEENSLGFFAFAIDNPRKDYPVEIELAYDLEGIVVITARDPETGQQMQQVMDKETEALDRALMEQQGWISKIEVNR